MRSISRKRNGSVTLLVAISMTAIMAVLAMALDGGLTLETRRTVQAAADAAALAAVDDMWEHYSTNNGTDPSGTALASALATAAADGFNNDGTTNTVTVHIAPTSGNFTGIRGYAEVIIQLNQPRGFSTVFGSGSLTIKARSVAGGQPGNVGILMLNPSIADAGEIDGNLNVLNGSQIYINSSNANDAVWVNTTAHLTTGGINVVGGLNDDGSITYTDGGGLTHLSTPLLDPLANIPEPVPSGTNYGNPHYSGTVTMQPGIYGDIVINANAHVTMAAGIYYITSTGSLTMNAGSTLVGNGVMIYNQGGDHLNLKAADSVYLTPPTSGTYRGISIFQPRIAQNVEIHLESSGPVTISGTLYAATGEFDLRPDGATTVFNFGAYICDQAEWSQGFDNSKNKSNGIINMNTANAAPTKRPLLVE